MGGPAHSFFSGAMQVWFNPSLAIENTLADVAAATEGFGPNSSPVCARPTPSSATFRPTVASGAKRNNNPNSLKLIDSCRPPDTDPDMVELSIAGPFINFKFTGISLELARAVLDQRRLQSGAGDPEGPQGRDRLPQRQYRQAGQYRPPDGDRRGDCRPRLLRADTIRDNHIGDWGNNFGTLIMKIKRTQSTSQTRDNPLAALDQLHTRPARA